VARGIASDRISVQHPGIRRPEVAAAPIAEREPLVVYVGRLEAYKRIDLVLDAVARVAREHPRVQLALLGRGAERPQLERRADALGIRARVEFTGYVSDAERDTWLARARVCVCASRKEGFGLTVIEANAVGTPNVTSDAPGLRDTVRHGETGFLVAGRDAAAFAARLGALLGDDALAARMSDAALEWSQRFDWERAATAMEQSLASAVAPGA